MTTLLVRVYPIDEVDDIQWNEAIVKVFTTYDTYEEFCLSVHDGEWFVSEPEEIVLDDMEI